VANMCATHENLRPATFAEHALFPVRAGKAPTGAVVATDAVSVDAFYDNGITLHGSPRRRRQDGDAHRSLATAVEPAWRRRRARATVNSYRHGASTRSETLREKVLRDLASRAATDAEFLKQARRDLKGTLAGFGYELTLKELHLVEDLRRRTAGMSDEQLARTLASGLRGRTGTPPARPAAPSWRGSGPGRPARPGG
jgi:hypothetical protein